MSTDKSFYLNNVNFSGYRSLNNSQINLMDNLNIIIGKNAAGKTNFLTCLHNSLLLNEDSIEKFNFKIDFDGNIKFFINSVENELDGHLIKGETSINLKESRYNLAIKSNDGKWSRRRNLSGGEVFNVLQKSYKVSFKTTFIQHGIPKKYPLIDKPISFNISFENGINHDLFKFAFDEESPKFSRLVAANLLFDFLNLTDNKKSNDGTVASKFVSKVILNHSKKLKKILNKLKYHSPIEDIKFSKNFNVFTDIEKQQITVTNLFIEFKVGKSWIPFKNLSDGTKRLLYIISEIEYSNQSLTLFPSSIGFRKDAKPILFIEEPELGIHPHQLMNLMKFIKSESNDKQIT